MFDTFAVRLDRAEETFSRVTGIRSVIDQAKAVDASLVELGQTRANGMSMAANQSPDALRQRIKDLESQVEVLRAALETMAAEHKVDTVTRVSTRAAFEEQSRLEWQRCATLSAPLAIAFFDVDNFKEFNDAHSHLVGDKVLASIAAQIARGSRRSGDVVARVSNERDKDDTRQAEDGQVMRYGGDEFVVLFPLLSIQDVAGVCERIRASIDDMKMRQGQVVLRATVSVGVASVRPDSSHSLAELIETADRACLHAKRNGRNCVVASIDDGFAIASIEPEVEQTQNLAQTKVAAKKNSPRRAV